MTKIQRIEKIISGILMLACCFLLVNEPEFGLYVVALILGVSLLLSGLRSLIFYFTMARHMVGGKAILYRAIIILDLAVFTLSMVDDPHYFIMLYLLVIHAFSGVMAILRALEARRYGASAWHRSFASGIVNIIVALGAVAAVVFLHSTTDLVFLYAACLFYSGCVQIVSAFQKTAIVYIQ